MTQGISFTVHRYLLSKAFLKVSEDIEFYLNFWVNSPFKKGHGLTVLISWALYCEGFFPLTGLLMNPHSLKQQQSHPYQNNNRNTCFETIFREVNQWRPACRTGYDGRQEKGSLPDLLLKFHLSHPTLGPLSQSLTSKMIATPVANIWQATVLQNHMEKTAAGSGSQHRFLMNEMDPWALLNSWYRYAKPMYYFGLPSYSLLGVVVENSRL